MKTIKTMHASISGMHCDGCVESLRAALARTAGVVSCDIRLNEAEIVMDTSQCGVADIVVAIRRAGPFGVTGFRTEGE